MRYSVQAEAHCLCSRDLLLCCRGKVGPQGALEKISKGKENDGEGRRGTLTTNRARAAARVAARKISESLGQVSSLVNPLGGHLAQI